MEAEEGEEEPNKPRTMSPTYHVVRKKPPFCATAARFRTWRTPITRQVCFSLQVMNTAGCHSSPNHRSPTRDCTICIADRRYIRPHY